MFSSYILINTNGASTNIFVAQGDDFMSLISATVDIKFTRKEARRLATEMLNDLDAYDGVKAG